ncbi:MAG: GTP-binding protein [Prolixibacteraceae bacterium]|nr:GTP-binding protein [Prolixibacteraceae bacterium]
MKKTPVTIISGFLGSGKTTAIIRLLEQKKPDECWAIVVNEFGKISIDGQTLQSRSVMGSVFDISGGCICCSAKIYLKENLEKIIETNRFDRIIIEPSGLGGIEMVSDIVGAIPELELMPVICMVDMTALDNPKLQRNLIYQSQIRMADRIIFSKCDLVDISGQRDDLLDRFRQLFPAKNYWSLGITVLALYPGNTLEDQTTSETSKLLIPAHHLDDKGYIEQVFELEKARIFNIEEFDKLCREYPSVIRAKGYIRSSIGWELFNYTLSGNQTEPSPEQSASSLVVIAETTSFDLEGFRKKLFV